MSKKLSEKNVDNMLSSYYRARVKKEFGLYPSRIAESMESSATFSSDRRRRVQKALDQRYCVCCGKPLIFEDIERQKVIASVRGKAKHTIQIGNSFWVKFFDKGIVSIRKRNQGELSLNSDDVKALYSHLDSNYKNERILRELSKGQESTQ